MQGSDPFCDKRFAPQCFFFCSQDDVIAAGVDILDNARQVLQAAAGKVDKFLPPGKGMAVCDKDKQNLTGGKRCPCQDVADKTGVCFFIIDGDL